jgi:hypothetical protein
MREEKACLIREAGFLLNIVARATMVKKRAAGFFLHQALTASSIFAALYSVAVAGKRLPGLIGDGKSFSGFIVAS